MADQFQVTSDEALAALEFSRLLWFRLAVINRSGSWQASAFELTTGVAPPRWQPKRWVYEDAAFIAERADGATARAWFAASQMHIGELAITLPQIQASASCEHRSSGLEYTYEGLEWPSMVYDLGQWTGVNTRPPEPLIADGAPSFHTHAKAASSFFGVDMGQGGLADRPMHLRVQDLTGRIVSVVVGATELTASIEGSAVRGAVVELASDVEGPSEVVRGHSPQTVTFPLGGPPPANAWVVLKRGSAWIDRKFLRTIYAMSADAGVEYEADPGTELQSLITQGETSMIEFKSRLPIKGDRKYRLEIAGTVAAFANQDGGWLLIGVANDGTIGGITLTGTLDDAQVAIINLIKDVVTPLTDFDVTAHDIDGRHVIVVTVSQGASPPYGVEPANPRYYVRRGGTTFPASADAVRRLARSRPPSDQPSALGYLGR